MYIDVVVFTNYNNINVNSDTRLGTYLFIYLKIDDSFAHNNIIYVYIFKFYLPANYIYIYTN